MPKINLNVTVGTGAILVLGGVAIALAELSGVWAAFCILLGISFILIGNGERPAGLCFLVAALVFGGIGLVPLLHQ